MGAAGQLLQKKKHWHRGGAHCANATKKLRGSFAFLVIKGLRFSYASHSAAEGGGRPRNAHAAKACACPAGAQKGAPYK